MHDYQKLLHEVLQETDEHRHLDSLDMIVVQTALEARGVEVGNTLPAIATINGWMKWLRASSITG